MAKNQLNIENSTFENFHNYNYMNSNEEKPLENIRFNFPNGSSCFKGREDTLREIQELFETKNIVVLHGAPGIGKTETARQFALKNSKLFNKNLIWVYAETQENIENCFKKISEIPEMNTTDVPQIYAKFDNSNCLVIFDNAENMAAIKDFMPICELNETVKVLITSQFAEWNTPVCKIRIGTLKPEDALNILSEKLGETYKKIPQINWDKLVERLDCIPLSIQIVSSLLYEKFRTIPIENCDFDAFINGLMDGTFINSNFLLSEQNFYNKTVLSSIYSALNRLKMKEALDLLCFIAYLDADYIYHDDLLLIPSIKKSNDKLQEALIRLKDYSLIQFNFEENDYKIKVHRTIQLVLRKYDLNKRNKKMFKVTFKIILAHPDLLFLHKVAIFKYAEMEKFQKKIIQFYKKNETQVDSYLPMLAKNHCDQILQKLLPKFKDEFDKTTKYYKILNKMLFEAISNENSDLRTIDLLIKYGAKITYSPENNSKNGFHEASNWLSKELFDRLLESNDSEKVVNSQDEDGRTILHLLVDNKTKDVWGEFFFPIFEYNNDISKAIECIGHLISKWKADISLQDNELNNILHIACMSYNISLEMIKYLVEKCNCRHLVNSQNIRGETPLHLLFIFQYGCSDLFEIVLYFINECEADITIQNRSGLNNLSLACRQGNSKIIDFVLRSINNREIINIQNKVGDVAFTYLNYNTRIKEDEKIDLIKLFRESGMDFQIRNRNNETLAEIAKLCGLMKLSDELRRLEDGDDPSNERKIEIINETSSKEVYVSQSRGLCNWLVNKFK